MAKFLTAEVGIFFTIIAPVAGLFTQSTIEMGSVKENISQLQNHLIKQRAEDREEMNKQRAEDREEMNKQRAEDREEMIKQRAEEREEMNKQRAEEREEMIKQRAEDRKEIKYLIENTLKGLKNAEGRR